MQLNKPVVGVTGQTLWPLDDAMSIIWNGPGSGLYLGINATRPGGTMTRIEHRTADGQYDSRKAAAEAAAAFMAAAE